jgi:hypothetical protein
MVIEHTFVTTLEPNDTMRAAAEYLSARGFTRADPAAGFDVSGQPQAWTSLEMRRGKKKAARARNVLQLPQTVRLEWDRGRVNVALAIAANSAWGGGSALTVSGETPGKLKKMKLHTELLNSIALGLENHLAHDGSGNSDYTQWDTAEVAIRAAARRRFIRNTIIVVVFLALVITGVALLVMSANKR